MAGDLATTVAHQVKTFLGHETLEATIYSVERPTQDEYYAEGGHTVSFEARARFRRHPLAPPGRMEGCIRALRTDGAPQMGPSWPLRTREALVRMLKTSLWRDHLDYVLVFRRGNAATNPWAHDRREATIDAELYEEEGNVSIPDAGQQDTRLARLHLSERLALDIFPPQEGFIVFELDGGGPYAITGSNRDKKWLDTILTHCADLIQLYVGEVEPQAKG